jgi:hypothetical protein
MGDLLAAVRDLNEKMRALINAHDKGAFTAGDDAAPTDADTPDIVYQMGLRRQLNGQLERLRLIWLANDRPERKDVAELLKDPLGTETRATRRNVGVLTVLAVVMGIVGKAPGKVPGAEIAIDSHQWLFPMLLAAVIAYEFNAFRIYVRSDMVRRGLTELQASSYLVTLKQELATMGEWRVKFGVMASRLREEKGEALIAAIDKEWEMIGLKWRRESEDLEGELNVEDGRRRWDLHPPLVLTVLSFFALVIAGVRIYRTEPVAAPQSAIIPCVSAQPVAALVAPPTTPVMSSVPCVPAPTVTLPAPSASVSIPAPSSSATAAPSAVPLPP